MSNWSLTPSNSSTSIRLAKTSPVTEPVNPNIGVSSETHKIVISGIRSIEKKGGKKEDKPRDRDRNRRRRLQKG